MTYIELKYPENRNCYSANSRIRVIFKVLLNSKDINIKLSTSNRIVLYSYKNNPEMFYSTSTKPEIILSNSTVDFTSPVIFSHEVLQGHAQIQIRCRGEDNVWYEYTPSIDFQFIPLEYSRPHQYASKYSLENLRKSLISVLNGYSVYDADIVNRIQLPTGTFLTDYPYTSTHGILHELENLYNLVSVDSVPPSTVPLLDFDKLDLSQENPIVEAVLPDTSLSTIFPVDTSTGKYASAGNYFNYIIYVLKNML